MMLWIKMNKSWGLLSPLHTFGRLYLCFSCKKFRKGRTYKNKESRKEMLIHVGYELLFEVPSPVPMLLKLYLHPSKAPEVKKPEHVNIEPDIPIEEFIDSFGNRMGRLVFPTGRVRLWNEAVVEDRGQPDVVNPSAQHHAVQDLPLEVLPYLLGSRYCEVDLLSEPAWNLFGQIPPGWAQVQAVCDWVHTNIQFG